MIRINSIEMDSLMDSIEMHMGGLHISTEVIAIIATVATVIVATILLLISRRRKRGKVATLVGLCEAGKTLLLSRVR